MLFFPVLFVLQTVCSEWSNAGSLDQKLVPARSGEAMTARWQ